MTLRFDPTGTPAQRWANNRLQFVRLLGEIASTIEFDRAQRAALCASMDLEWDQILELLERAQAEWDAYTATIRTVRLPNTFAVYRLTSLGVATVLKAADVAYWACSEECAEALHRLVHPSAIGPDDGFEAGQRCNRCERLLTS
jgi:hypothetical protein